MLQNIAGATARRNTVISVFGDLNSSACGDKGSEGRDVKGVLAVSARSAQIDGTEFTQVDGQTQLLQCFSKAFEFLE